jgi:uncharacterized membrane protein (UPF0127 family)
MPRWFSAPQSLGGLAVLPLLGVTLVACERRIDEPIAARPLDPSALGGEPAPEKAAGKGRCIRATTPSPKRRAPTGPDPRCPRDTEASPPKLRAGKVTFIAGEGAETSSAPTGSDALGPSPKPLAIDTEIAENDHDRQRGLMFRTQMADTHGMIFVFADKDDHSFWMHNTCIPLDMLFIDEDGLIVGIEENTPTLSDDTFSVGCLSKYVLEVNAGWTRAHGIKAGQWVKIDL